MNRILSLISGWKGYVLLAIACLAVGFHQGWTVRGWKADADASATRDAAQQARYDAVAAALKTERSRARTTSRIEARAAEAQVQIREVTRTLIQEVPVYVTPAADARFDVPVGLVLLHDAAAAGTALIPDPAGVAYDAPSGLAPSALGATVVGNYGQCIATARQLTDLQDWVTAQAALAEGDEPPNTTQ